MRSFTEVAFFFHRISDRETIYLTPFVGLTQRTLQFVEHSEKRSVFDASRRRGSARESSPTFATDGHREVVLKHRFR